MVDLTKFYKEAVTDECTNACYQVIRDLGEVTVDKEKLKVRLGAVICYERFEYRQINKNPTNGKMRTFYKRLNHDLKCLIETFNVLQNKLYETWDYECEDGTTKQYSTVPEFLSLVLDECIDIKKLPTLQKDIEKRYNDSQNNKSSKPNPLDRIISELIKIYRELCKLDPTTKRDGNTKFTDFVCAFFDYNEDIFPIQKANNTNDDKLSSYMIYKSCDRLKKTKM